MFEIELGDVQAKFADIVWEYEPVSSGELVKICADELKWKKSTTYTVLKKLIEKGIFQNINGVVSAIVSRDEFFSAKSRKFVDETFHGSLPAFISAFAQDKALSAEEIKEIQQMIDKFREDG